MTQQPVATNSPTRAPAGDPTDDNHDAPARNGVRNLTHVLSVPIAAASRLIPSSPTPVALGAGALAVAGVIEWPVAAAIGLGYLAVRRWH